MATAVAPRPTSVQLGTYKKTEKVEMSCPLSVKKGYTLEESYNRGLDKLSELYGTDFRKL